MKPLRVGIIGMGGFAATHHDIIARLEKSGEYQLVCACDPHIDAFDSRVKALRFDERHVRVFTDYVDMLESCHTELDVVTIPTPIPLHAPMHHACIERGLAVYLEKPPTLDCAELESMIDLDAGAPYQTSVAFNFIVEPERQALKSRLVAGEFGPVQRVTALALWPREASYFTRNDWAGRLMKDGKLVLDSCIGNAMAHQVHNALFWCGIDNTWGWGEINQVQAELYRAHSIEGMDTAFVAATTRQGIDLRISMSHACSGSPTQEECITCEKATLRYHIRNSGPGGSLYSITWDDGREETGGLIKRDVLEMNFLAYAAYLRGKASRPTTRLADSRPFVQLNNLAYIASRTITTVPSPYILSQPDGFLEVTGLPEAIREFARSGRFPSAQSQPWSIAGGTATPLDLPSIYQVVKALRTRDLT